MQNWKEEAKECVGDFLDACCARYLHICTPYKKSLDLIHLRGEGSTVRVWDKLHNMTLCRPVKTENGDPSSPHLQLITSAQHPHRRNNVNTELRTCINSASYQMLALEGWLGIILVVGCRKRNGSFLAKSGM